MSKIEVSSKRSSKRVLSEIHPTTSSTKRTSKRAMTLESSGTASSPKHSKRSSEKSSKLVIETPSETSQPERTQKRTSSKVSSKVSSSKRPSKKGLSEIPEETLLSESRKRTLEASSETTLPKKISKKIAVISGTPPETLLKAKTRKRTLSQVTSKTTERAKLSETSSKTASPAKPSRRVTRASSKTSSENGTSEESSEQTSSKLSTKNLEKAAAKKSSRKKRSRTTTKTSSKSSKDHEILDSNNSIYRHLSEEERRIVVGFRPPDSALQSKKLPPKNVQIDCEPYHKKSSEKSTKTTKSLVSLSSVPSLSKESATRSCSLLSTPPSMTTSSSRNSSSIVSPSSSRALEETPKNSFDCSLLMQVSREGKMVYVNPFLPVLTCSMTSHSSVISPSHSVIVIEDSPAQKAPISLTTSTPRPSLEPPAFDLFPSPIALSNTNLQTPSQANDGLVLNIEESDLDETVILNKANADGEICQSEEEMDTNVDEEENMETEDEIALNTLIDARENTMHMESETVGTLTEMVAQKSVLIQSQTLHDETVIESSETDKGHTVLVIDTNVFISALYFVKDALKRATDGGLLVLLPWAVLQELDYLKQHDKDIRYQCMNAVRFINEQLLSENCYLISQTPQQAMERIIPIDSNDDKILVCCLQRMKSYNKDRVILVTRDINLSSKARVTGFESSHNEKLWKLLNESKKTTTIIDKVNKVQENTTSAGNKNNLAQNKNINRQPMQRSNDNLNQNNNNNNNNRKPMQHSNNNLPYNKTNRPTVQHNVNSEQVPPNNITRVLNKMSSIWNLIACLRHEVEKNLSWGPQNIVFPRAKAMANRMLENTKCLLYHYDRCLMLSPLHLWNSPDLFKALKFHLDNFYAACKTSYTDTSGNVFLEDIINFFKDTNNRPQLMVGLHQLEEFIVSFSEMSF